MISSHLINAVFPVVQLVPAVPALIFLYVRLYQVRPGGSRDGRRESPVPRWFRTGFLAWVLTQGALLVAALTLRIFGS